MVPPHPSQAMIIIHRATNQLWRYIYGPKSWFRLLAPRRPSLRKWWSWCNGTCWSHHLLRKRAWLQCHAMNSRMNSLSILLKTHELYDPQSLPKSNGFPMFPLVSMTVLGWLGDTTMDTPMLWIHFNWYWIHGIHWNSPFGAVEPWSTNKLWSLLTRRYCGRCSCHSFHLQMSSYVLLTARRNAYESYELISNFIWIQFSTNRWPWLRPSIQYLQCWTHGPTFHLAELIFQEPHECCHSPHTRWHPNLGWE